MRPARLLLLADPELLVQLPGRGWIAGYNLLIQNASTVRMQGEGCQQKNCSTCPASKNDPASSPARFEPG